MDTASTELTSFGADAPILEVMSTMRSMRRLRPDPVEPELLTQLVQAATWAPTASNVQAYTFLIVTDRARMRALAGPVDGVLEVLRTHGGAAGGHVA